MRFLFATLLVLIVSAACVAQPVYGRDLLFNDSTRTAFEFIGSHFRDNSKGLDTCCLFAFGSVKFTVHSDEKLTTIQTSAGIPAFIADQLKEAVLSTLYFWRLTNGYKKATVIIPVFVAPATACRREEFRDDILWSAAHMYDYAPPPRDRVRHSEYVKKAKKTEAGIVFPMLLIKGTLVKCFD